MRLTDLEAWVEQQFLDTNPAPKEEPEPEPVPLGGPGSDEPPTPAPGGVPPGGRNSAEPALPTNVAVPPRGLGSAEAPTAAPVRMAPGARGSVEQRTPSPVRPTASRSQVAPTDDADIPELDQYLPFLKGARQTTDSPSSETPDSEVGGFSPTEPDAQAWSQDVAAPEPASGQNKVPANTNVAGAAEQVGAASDEIADDASPVVGAEARSPQAGASAQDGLGPGRGRRGRAKSRARSVSPPELAPPLTGEQFWQLAPRHVRTLIAMGHDDVVQGSYKRQFKESRLALIERLLDPTLSLEDTARLLNVCPTTVRRYTNRGLLHHQRTTGDQRRFKLSDVLSFMEAQSPVEAD